MTVILKLKNVSLIVNMDTITKGEFDELIKGKEILDIEYYR